MADDALPGSSRADALDRLDKWLSANAHAKALPASKVNKGYERGWSLTVEAAGQSFEVHFLIDARFPWSKPRIALAKPPGAFPSFPHVETDGKLCVLSDMDECDPDDVTGTAALVLAGAQDILAQGVAGTNVEEFRTEFLTYWNPGCVGTVRSIVHPSGPSRWFGWWAGQRLSLAADTAADLRAYLLNASVKNHVATAMIRKGLLLWLQQPLRPSEYPKTAEDVAKMAAEAGFGAKFETLLRDTKDSVLVLLGADTGNGVCFAGVRLTRTARSRNRWKRHRPMRDLSPAHSKFAVHRYRVDRADPWWVHGRDSNLDLTDLRGMRVALIGCGSLGSPVARLLAQSGVGTLVLIDPETMELSNGGRHALGVESASGTKASQLATLLSINFPHSTFIAHDSRWQDVPDALVGVDLVISTVGSWSVDAPLAQRQVEQQSPPVIYAWTEAHGAAGHAVAIGLRSGCLQCHMNRHGVPDGQVALWPRQTLKQEPACGAFFQPYGPAAIMMTAVLTADLALDVLLERESPGTHRIASARESLIKAAGGSWSEPWTAQTGAGHEGGRTEQFEWAAAPGCRMCAGKGPA